MVEAGASIVIVGGAIIKAKDVAAAARTVKKSMGGAKVKEELTKKYCQVDLFDAFSSVSSPNVADAQHKRGVMVGILPRISHGQKMVGRALTVQTANGDWAKPVEAIDQAQRGRRYRHRRRRRRRRGLGGAGLLERAGRRASTASSSTARRGTSTRSWRWTSLLLEARRPSRRRAERIRRHRPRNRLRGADGPDWRLDHRRRERHRRRSAGERGRGGEPRASMSWSGRTASARKSSAAGPYPSCRSSRNGNRYADQPPLPHGPLRRIVLGEGDR